MTDTPVTKSVQSFVRRYYCGPLDRLSLAFLIFGIFYGLWQSYIEYYNWSSTGEQFRPFTDYYLIACHYFVFAVLEAKHVFCRIRYKKDHADQTIAQPGKMLNHRFTRLLGIALVVIYKVYKSLFVYHQIVTAINLIMYNLLVVESIAVLAFSLDIAYLQELSETSSDLVEGDLESKAGLTVVEKITEKSSSLQTPLNVTESETQRQISINTLIS